MHAIYKYVIMCICSSNISSLHVLLKSQAKLINFLKIRSYSEFSESLEIIQDLKG